MKPIKKKSSLLILAKKINQSFFTRQLFFFICAIISIVFSGYHFGSFDQAAHIPFVKKFADPNLYPHDPFLSLSGVHYSFFWRFFVPFEKLGILEESMFIIHLIATHLTFAMIWRVTITIFKKPSTALLSVLFFILPHLGFGALSVTEFSLLNRTFVLPILLFAIDLYLHKKTVASFLILGLVYNLHALSVHFVFALFTLDLLLQHKSLNWRQLIIGALVFIVAASPLLIWRFGSEGLDLSIQPQWYSLVNYGLLYHLFSPFGSFLITLLTFSGVASTILFFVLRSKASKNPLDSSITNFVLISVFFVGVAYAISYFYPAVFLVQLQLIRAGIFILFFAYLYLANYIASSIEADSKYPVLKWSLIIAVVILPLPLLVLPIFLLTFSTLKHRVKTILIILITAVFFITSIFIMTRSGMWRQGAYISGYEDSWKQVAIWARDNTSKDTIFITPPHYWSLIITDWRVISERQSVFTYSEMLELIFDPKFFPDLTERFDAVAPGARAQLSGDFFENRQVIKEGYESLSSEQLTSVAAKYGAKYIVIEKPNQLPLAIEFENNGFTVYEVANSY